MEEARANRQFGKEKSHPVTSKHTNLSPFLAPNTVAEAAVEEEEEAVVETQWPLMTFLTMLWRLSTKHKKNTLKEK